MGFKQKIPWWGKIASKLVLSRLPVDYKYWRRLGLFKAGGMDNVKYAVNVFKSHADSVGLNSIDKLAGKTILELGPGDSVASALIAKACGARTILVDVGPFATRHLDYYRSLVVQLESMGLSLPEINSVKSLDELLEVCDARYLTAGLDSLRKLQDDSVDFIFSHAVLEHIRKREFLCTQQELARILKRDGVCSHEVDLRDHLGNSLNNLRFSDRIWESDLFANSGFYTNRITFEQMLEMFRRAGFDVEVIEVRRWDKLPLDRRHLDREFRYIPEEILTVSGFRVLLRHCVSAS